MVHGAGGHGARPHLARDPVPVLAEIVTALHAVVTRQFDIFEPVVVSVGVLDAGTAHNVIAESARLEATMRSFSAGTVRASPRSRHVRPAASPTPTGSTLTPGSRPCIRPR